VLIFICIINSCKNHPPLKEAVIFTGEKNGDADEIINRSSSDSIIAAYICNKKNIGNMPVQWADVFIVKFFKRLTPSKADTVIIFDVQTREPFKDKDLSEYFISIEKSKKFSKCKVIVPFDKIDFILHMDTLF
jgi:hypothetical protein